MSLSSNVEKAKEAFFKNTFLLEKSIPHPKDRQRFIEMTSFVNNTEHFYDVSKLDYLLRLDLSRQSLTYSQQMQVSQWFNDFASQDACLPTNVSVNHFFTWGERFNLLRDKIDESLVDDILSGLETDINNLDNEANPLSFGTHNEMYKHVMKHYCMPILKYYARQSGAPVSPNALERMVDDVLSYVGTKSKLRKLPKFVENCTSSEEALTQSYYWNVCNSVRNRFIGGQNDSARTTAIKLILVTFYPYFMLEYIIDNVAQQESSQPANYLFHRMAVLVSYMYIFLAVSVLIQRNQNMRGTSKHYTRTLSLLSKLNDDIFSRESLSRHAEEDSTDLHEDIVETRKVADELAAKNQYIQDMRTNVEKAAYNNVLSQPVRKKAKWSMITWLLLLILNIALTFTILLAFYRYKNVFIGIQTMFLVVLIIYYIWSLFR